MNKSLIFAALFVAPNAVLFAGPRSVTKSPVPSAMQGLVSVARQASPTLKNWDAEFATLFALIERDPANAPLVRTLVKQSILPSLGAARDAMLIAHMAASNMVDEKQTDKLSVQIDKISEGMKLLHDLLALAEAQLKEQRVATPPMMIKPLAFNPADK